MAANGAAVETGHGCTIVFSTSGFTGQLVNWTLGGIHREAIPAPHMGLTGPGANKFGNLPKLASEIQDGGELTFTIRQHTKMTVTTQQPPIKLAAETVTITFPLASGDVTAAKIAATAFVTDVEIVAGGSEELIDTNVTVAFSGEVTVTPASTA